MPASGVARLLTRPQIDVFGPFLASFSLILALFMVVVARKRVRVDA